MEKKRQEDLQALENQYNQEIEMLRNKLNKELEELRNQKEAKLKEVEDYVNKVKEFINSIPSEKIVTVRVVREGERVRLEGTEEEYWREYDEYWNRQANYQIGTLFVHRRGIALLHPGEMVLTAEASQALLQFLGSMRPQKTANITMNFNVSGGNIGDTRKLYQMISKVVRSELRRMGVWVQ